MSQHADRQPTRLAGVIDHQGLPTTCLQTSKHFGDVKAVELSNAVARALVGDGRDFSETFVEFGKLSGEQDGVFVRGRIFGVER